ncbi:MAG: hypothetical protein JEZ04_01815 [Spirochaetales bacterium]|nr:hypothetical protein [Spirochaetales bacterium]
MKKLILIISLLSIASASYAQSESRFSIHATPQAEISLPTESNYFTTGGGIDIGLDLRMPFWPVLGIIGDFSYSYLPIITGDGTNFLKAGGGLSFTLPRIAGIFSPALFASAGYYYGIIADNSAAAGGNLYFSGGGRLGWVLTPNYNLGLELKYKAYLDGLGGMLHHGLNIGVSSSFNFHDAQDVRIQNIQLQEIFPVLYKFYNTNSFGSIEISNPGAVPMEDIKVSVFVEKYMDNPTIVAGPAFLGSGKSAVVDLFALFSENVLDITEATIVSANIKIDYTRNEDEQSTEQAVSLRLFDRHAMTWDDTRKAAAFVNYKDPAVIEIGKTLSRLVKSTVNVVDVNLCTAAALHEALGLYGLEYVIDPTSPFTELSEDVLAVDFIQFPYNTLYYKSGDCDDLSILYTSILQSVGIDTAFITIPGHIFIAFALKLDPDEALKSISSREDLIIHEGRAWVPLEITMVGTSFMQAWKTGANEWNEWEPAGQAELYQMGEAWADYEPVGFGGKAEDIDFVGGEDLTESYLTEINRFINREIYAQSAAAEEKINQQKRTPANLNKLGTIYARYGKTDDAMGYFKEALALDDYYPAMLNMGNLYFLDNNLNLALDYYRQAEKIRPENAVLQLQISRVFNELGLFDESAKSFEKVRKANKALAERYAFLDVAAASTRASARDSSDFMLWLEEE